MGDTLERRMQPPQVSKHRFMRTTVVVKRDVVVAVTRSDRRARIVPVVIARVPHVVVIVTAPRGEKSGCGERFVLST